MEGKENTKKQLRPGERGFSIFLLLLAGFFLWQAIAMYADDPSISSYGGLPLLLSIFLAADVLYIIFVEDLRKLGPGGVNPGRRLLAGVKYLFPLDVAAFVGLVVLYCAALYLKLGFIISTVVFLLASMEFFIPKELKKNVIYTIIVVAAVYAIFKLLFKITLP